MYPNYRAAQGNRLSQNNRQDDGCLTVVIFTFPGIDREIGLLPLFQVRERIC